MDLNGRRRRDYWMWMEKPTLMVDAPYLEMMAGWSKQLRPAANLRSQILGGGRRAAGDFDRRGFGVVCGDLRGDGFWAIDLGSWGTQPSIVYDRLCLQEKRRCQILGGGQSYGRSWGMGIKSRELSGIYSIKSV